MSSQQATKKTVATIKTKTACRARFCCFETSERFSGNGKSLSENARGQGKRGVEANIRVRSRVRQFLPATSSNRRRTQLLASAGRHAIDKSEKTGVYAGL